LPVQNCAAKAGGGVGAEVDRLAGVLAVVHRLLTVAEGDRVVLPVGVVLGVDQPLHVDRVAAEVGRRVAHVRGVDARRREGRVGVVGEDVAQRQQQVGHHVDVARAVEDAAVEGAVPVVEVVGVLPLLRRSHLRAGVDGGRVVQLHRIAGEDRLQVLARAEAAEEELVGHALEVGGVQRAAQRRHAVEAIGVGEAQRRRADAPHRGAGDDAVGGVDRLGRRRIHHRRPTGNDAQRRENDPDFRVFHFAFTSLAGRAGTLREKM